LRDDGVAFLDELVAGLVVGGGLQLLAEGGGEGEVGETGLRKKRIHALSANFLFAVSFERAETGGEAVAFEGEVRDAGLEVDELRVEG
jgi:hypothetical protein